jgi:hypothetical protein
MNTHRIDIKIFNILAAGMNMDKSIFIFEVHISSFSVEVIGFYVVFLLSSIRPWKGFLKKLESTCILFLKVREQNGKVSQP